MKAKNCLIFGGSGQIGRNLIRKLTKNNFKATLSELSYQVFTYLATTTKN